MSDSDYGTDYNSGHDGYEGQENHDLEAGQQESGHQAYDAENDHALNASQFGEAQEHELDEHFQHVKHIEYDDGKGGHYEETEYTIVDVHEESSEQEFGQQYAEADHAEANQEESFSAIEFFQEHISSQFSDFGDNFGKLGEIGHVGEIGHGSDYSDGDFGLNAASNSGGDETGHGELSAASN